MQKESDAVTESVPKPKKIITTRTIFLFLILGLGGLLVFVVASSNRSPQPEASNCVIEVPVSESNTDASKECVKLEYADTPSKRTQGLSGRENLALNEGMLFIFDEADRVCMWMKDMNFSLDMVWLDSEKQITKIEQNVTPETYPNSFCGGNQDKYVIELSSGAADKAQLQVGNQLNF